MIERIAEASPRFKARIAGVFYLLTAGTAFAFSVRGRLVVSGDAGATAANILAHQSLFRMALVADLIGVACYIVVTALFYDLFKPVKEPLFARSLLQSRRMRCSGFCLRLSPRVFSRLGRRAVLERV